MRAKLPAGKSRAISIYAELKRAQARAQELEELLSISSELGSSQDLERFLETFVVRAADFLGFSRSFIALVEQGKIEIRYAADSNTGRQMRLPLDAGVTQRILTTHKPYWTEDAGSEPDADQHAVKMFDIRQYMALPVFGRDKQLIGVLGLLDKLDGKKISDRDVRRAESLTGEVALALQTAQMLHQSEEHRENAENLVEMALDLSSSLSLPDLVSSFTRRARALMSTRAAVMALAYGNELETVLFEDNRVQSSRELNVELAAELTAFVNRHPAQVFSGEASQVFSAGLLSKLMWQNVLVCRLAGSGGDLLAVLVLGDTTRKLQSADYKMLQAMLGHASVALDNSRLFTRIAQSSRQWAEIFDSLTDFIVVHDENHRVTRVNRALADFLRQGPAELIGIQMRDLMSRGEIGGDQACPFCKSGKELDEFYHQRMDRTYLVSSYSMRGGVNEGVQTIHVAKDLTEHREAERRYRELFDNVQEGVFFSSPEGRFLEVNDALVRMLGYSNRDELLKIDIPTQFYATPQMRENVREMTESGDMSNREVTLKKKNGALIHALENAIAVRNSEGRVIQYRGLILDITETKRFQGQLQRERDFNTQVLNNTHSLILVVDTAGLISFANRRAYEAGHFGSKQLVGGRLLDIIFRDDKPLWIEHFERVLNGRSVANLQIDLVRGDGVTGKFSANVSPMRNEAGQVTSVVVVMTDITELATIQAKLMQTEKMAAVGQLVSGVAHEVNNPLTAIMGFADLMLENPELPTDIHQDLRVIMQEAQRTKEIVQNLLNFARPVTPQRRPVDLNAIIRRTVALRSYDFSSHGVEVVERFQENLPEVVGDWHQLQQVFLNILNNAYDAVREGKRAGRIEIETELQKDGFARVSFHDNGPGVKNPERIFDPFFTTKDVGKGTGLGLSICYGIIREHGGEIICRADKQPGEGATFCVRLPLAQAREEHERASAAGGLA